MRVLALLCLLLVAACTRSEAPAAPCVLGLPGVHFDDVRGPVPSYAEEPLADFAAAGAMCRGLWLAGGRPVVRAAGPGARR